MTVATIPLGDIALLVVGIILIVFAVTPFRFSGNGLEYWASRPSGPGIKHGMVRRPDGQGVQPTRTVLS